MKTRVWSTMLAVVSASILAGKLAYAGAGALRIVAPAGGGLDAVEVVIDGAEGAVRVRRCKTVDCNDPGGAAGASRSMPIPIDRAELDLANATLEVLPIGEGRSVVHVRVGHLHRKDLAFEAVVAGNDAPAIFAGLTGSSRGEEGDRHGQVVLFYERDAKTKFVLVADQREDTRICGQETTPLSARGLDPKTMTLRGATLHRLERKVREDAVRVVAKPRASVHPPLARILVATGGSSDGARALTDGNIDTTWSESRPGDGHGEFATIRGPAEIPLHGVVVTIAPPSPKPTGASPRTFFVATDEGVVHVTIPEDAWKKPGASYDVLFPRPVRTGCVAVVLDEAYPRELATPEVSLAEISALTRFDIDDASLDDVARELTNPPRAEEAAALLKRSGEEGLGAVAKRWANLDERGRALAVDVAASAGACEGAAIELLTRALTDKDAEVKRRALGRIERCGKAATRSLALAVRSDDEARAAASAPLLATIAPLAALDPIGDRLGKGSTETRRALRSAFARASVTAPRERLRAMLAPRDGLARLDVLRALGSRLPELRPESAVVLADALRDAPDMATRYLALQPLAQLARAPDATSGELTRLFEMARRDPEWAVRARAIELSTGIPPLAPAIVEAVADPEPRVREAALRSIGSGKLAAGTNAARTALATDRWTFVRVAAADAIGAVDGDVAGYTALAKALDDESAKVRAAAVVALGNVRATRHAEKIVARLDDGHEDVEVRALAARTLGAMCVQSAANRLTRLARLARSPVDEADERIGMAAIDALAALHPSDLADRLAPLRGKDVRLPLRRAADRALAEPGSCR